MSILSDEKIIDELPDDVTNEDGEITEMNARSTGFVNSYAKHYYPFENFDATNEVTRAPKEIVQVAMEVSKAMFFLATAQTSRDGKEYKFWNDLLTLKMKELAKIKVEPTWETQVVSLDANEAMLIGNPDNGAGYPQIIPFEARVDSDSSNVWVREVDFNIRKGGRNDDEYIDGWYLYAIDTDLEGTLNYLRTYRNDGGDYSRYKK